MSNYENKIDINKKKKLEIEIEDETHGNVFNRFNVFFIYLPLMLYLALMSYQHGFIKGFCVYFCTAPIIIMMLLVNMSDDYEITFINILKLLFINILGFVLCLGIIYIIL